MKTYLCARSRPYGMNQTFVNAYVYRDRRTYDRLSPDCYSPVLLIEADTHADALKAFRREYREYHQQIDAGCNHQVACMHTKAGRATLRLHGAIR